MKLYDYFRSSAAYRVRIALSIKELHVKQHSVHLGRQEHRDDAFSAVNPQRLIPALALDFPAVLTQSLAICEYLEEVKPHPPLLPVSPLARAQVRAVAAAIACDIHPVNNLRILNYLTGRLGLSEAQRLEWYRHWVAEGLAGVEATLAIADTTGTFCFGDTPGLADVFLVPQVFNARGFECDMTPYPTIVRIDMVCQGLESFARAHPARQPDSA